MRNLKTGLKTFLAFVIPQTELLAPTVIELVAPCDGYIDVLRLTIQTAITTGGNIVVKHGDALATTVAGIDITIADSATKGTRYEDTSTPGSSTRFVNKGDRIGIEPSAGFATGGAVNGVLEISEADVSPALPEAS